MSNEHDDYVLADDSSVLGDYNGPSLDWVNATMNVRSMTDEILSSWPDPDDSHQRTAEHTEHTSAMVEELVTVVQSLVALTAENIEASAKAEKRSANLTKISLWISGASASAAIVSVFLFIASMT